jgi:predicted transcriptional regulator
LTLINSNKKKRKREEIIASILDTARLGATKTKIMYVSFLSFSQLQKYLNYALTTKLVDLDPIAGKYLTTNKGLEYLKRFEEVQNIENNIAAKRRSLTEILEDRER